MEDRKYVTTKKAKAKVDRMTMDIVTKMGYGAKAPAKPQQPGKAEPKVTAKPTVKPKVTATTIKKGEAEFIKELESGKTFEEARKAIIKKYGFWPNGRTN